MKRLCYICEEEISECMGYVIAGDFIDYLKGKRGTIRELCSKDIMKLELLTSNKKTDLNNSLKNLLKNKSLRRDLNSRPFAYKATEQLFEESKN